MRGWRPAGVLFFGVAAVYSVTAVVGQHQSTDTVATFSPAWQLARHGNLWMDGLAGRSNWLVHVRGSGHLVSARFPGAIFLAAPFYAVLSGGSSAPTVGPSLVASVLCSAGTIAVMFLFLDRLVSRRVALGGALLGAFGTATWNVSSAALWTHGPAQLALALGVLAIVNGRRAWAGAAFGAASVVRPPLLVVAGALLFLAMVRGRSWRTMTLGLGPLLAVGLLLTYNGLVFGRIGLDSGYQESGARDVASGPVHFLGNLPGTLFSPARGLFVLSPFLLLLCWGVAPAWRRAPLAVQDCAVAGIAYLLSQLWLVPFTGADGFYGYRLPLESLILVAPMLALAYQELVTTRARRVLFAVSAAISVAFESVAAFLRHPPLVVADAWRSFMPATAVVREPLVASVAAALAVSAVIAWVLTASRSRPASSVRSESPPGV